MKELVETLKPMLNNPNAILFDNGVVYLFTSDGEFISLSVSKRCSDVRKGRG